MGEYTFWIWIIKSRFLCVSVILIFHALHILQAIKSHELDLLALGNTYVMKSHKGEQVIEKVVPIFFESYCLLSVRVCCKSKKT